MAAPVVRAFGFASILADSGGLMLRGVLLARVAASRAAASNV